jgi:hypothetical protein
MFGSLRSVTGSAIAALERLHLWRHTALNKCVGWHVSDRVTKAAGRLSCIKPLTQPQLVQTLSRPFKHIDRTSIFYTRVHVGFDAWAAAGPLRWLAAGSFTVSA